MIKGVELSDVHQAQVFFLVTDKRALMAIFQIEIDNAKTLWHRFQQWENTGPYNMDPTEGQLSHIRWIQSFIRALHFACLNISPTVKDALVVKKQIPLRLPAAHDKQGIRRLTYLRKLIKIKVAQDIHIVDEYRGIGIK